MLPFVLLAWAWISAIASGRHGLRWRRGRAARDLFSLRAFTPAMTPATAPAFYRFTFAPLAVLDNTGRVCRSVGDPGGCGPGLRDVAVSATATPLLPGPANRRDARWSGGPGCSRSRLAAGAVEPVCGLPVVATAMVDALLSIGCASRPARASR